LTRIPTLETLKKQYIDLKNTSELHIDKWLEYLIEESNRIRDVINEEDGEFEGKDYTLPSLMTFLKASFYPIWVKGDDRTDYRGFGDTKDFTSHLRMSGTHSCSDIELFGYLIKNNSIAVIVSSYEAYRNYVIKIIQNREKYDKDEAGKEEREIQFKKNIISKFVSMYNITDEESEAVILYISSKAPKNIRKKYKNFKKNTLLALKFINRYSTQQSIRVEDALTVLLEYL